jgi:nicotinamide riboside transporter PnuC
MESFFITLSFFFVLGVLAYGFYEWLEKIEVEKEYLQNLVKEQEKSKNTLRKKL